MIFDLTPKDILDIFIVSLFFFSILNFVLKKKHTLLIVLGILFWFFVFFLSLQLDLSLTNFIFRWFISLGLLLVLIIIFNQEIRDLFYYFGNFGFNFIRYFNKIDKNITETIIETIVEAIKEMSEKRIGAIIVIEGKSHIDEFISSGYLLDGFISKPLILSIFDPNSPGHDGAMIIRNNKIYKFSVHLPLSKNVEKIKEKNLRHRAGLGITEVSDAMAIIVSEETGDISLAREGKIEKIKEIFELKEKFLKLHISETDKKKNHLFIFQILSVKNFLLFLVALVASLSLFLVINNNRSLIQKAFIVPVEFTNIPQNLVIKEFKPTELTITLKGSKSAFDVFNLNDLKVIVDLKNYSKYSVSKWNSVLIQDEDVLIKIPKNLFLINVSPSNIRFYLEKIEESQTQ